MILHLLLCMKQMEYLFDHMEGVDIERRNRIKEFMDTLKASSIKDIDKTSLKSIIYYFNGKIDPKIASRSFLISGDPGVGKTYLSEKLLNALDVEILYIAPSNLPFKNWVRCYSLDEIIRKADNDKPQVLFLDDLQYIVDMKDVINLSDKSRRDVMRILELVKSNYNKILLITSSTIPFIEWSIFDRIEVKINIDIPDETGKNRFLNIHYKEYLTPSQMKYIVDNSIGYNYRGLTELIKLAYRIGGNRITKKALKKAISNYKVSSLEEYDILNDIDINMKDLIGKENAKDIIKRLREIYRNINLSKELGLKRTNLLIFHGPPGTGKSFTAKALAGELGFPLVNVKNKNLFGENADSIDEIIDIARRYRNCVVFIDEADKLFGGEELFGGSNPILGELHKSIEGVNDDEIQSVLILAMNNPHKLGKTLLDRFTIIHFDYPSYEERVIFFKDKIQNARKHIKISISHEYLSRNTDKMSFRDIERLWNEIIFYYIENNMEINKENINTLINKIGKENEIEGYI